MKQLKKYNDLDQVGLIINYYSYNHNCYDKNGKYICDRLQENRAQRGPDEKIVVPDFDFPF